MRFYQPFSSIKAITFDLDDTLYDNEPIIRQAEQVLRKHLAQKFPTTANFADRDWLRIKRQHLAQRPELASDMGRLRKLSLASALAGEQLNANELSAAVDQAFDCFYNARSDFKVNETIYSSLTTLAQHVPLLAITNGNVDVDKIGLQGVFSKVLHASLERPAKPHPAMFNEAAQQLAVPRYSILHVGDNLVKDVWGAHQAGYRTAWYAMNRPMDLSQEPVQVLPDVVLSSIADLTSLV